MVRHYSTSNISAMFNSATEVQISTINVTNITESKSHNTKLEVEHMIHHMQQVNKSSVCVMTDACLRTG